VIYRFNATPIKISMEFFTEIRKYILKFPNNQRYCEKEQAGNIKLSDFKVHFEKAMEKKTSIKK
jgi:hypothetical protein